MAFSMAQVSLPFQHIVQGEFLNETFTPSDTILIIMYGIFLVEQLTAQ